MPRVKRMAVMGTGLPAKVMVKHRYVDTIGLSGTTGAPSAYFFSANGMYDPDITGTGHQPLYFDQYAALYNHYTVIGSKVTFRCAPAANSYSTMRVVGTIDDDASNVSNNVDAISEQTQGTNIHIFPANSTDTVRYVRLKWSAKKIFGGSILGNDKLRGTPTSNPAEQSYYCLVLQPAIGTNGAINVVVEIEYIAIWDELKGVAQS